MCKPEQQDRMKNSIMSVLTNQETASNNNNQNDDTEENNDKQQQQQQPSCWKRIVNFYWKYEFLILVVVAILLARAYPPLGAVYLAPDITATWIAVIFIFVMAGLTLKTEEFKKAFMNIYFNVFVQVFNFGIVSAVVYGCSRGLAASNILTPDLADGMVICASLPMTINMVLILTKAGHGDEAAAIFNASFGNMVGVFLSPLLILGYLGVHGEVNLVDVFYKLALRVVAPVLVGQLLQKTSPILVNFVKQHKWYFKQAQQYCLVFIVYTVFCTTFYDNETQSSSIGDIFLMIAFQFVLLAGLMVLAWICLKVAFRNQPKLRVMGLFGCTHKTVAMGVPLINAIYENNPSIGLYTLPLLIWHPMQLVLGSLLAPRLADFVDQENERLGIADDEDDVVVPVDNAEGEATATEEGRISSVDEQDNNEDQIEAIPTEERISSSLDVEAGNDDEGNSVEKS